MDDLTEHAAPLEVGTRAARAAHLLVERINCQADAAKEYPPGTPPCPPGMLRVYARNDLREAGLDEWADLLVAGGPQ